MLPTQPPPCPAGSGGGVDDAPSTNTDGLLQQGGGLFPNSANSAGTPAFDVAFARRTARVRTLALHPSRPHCLIACYSGLVACFDVEKLLHPTVAVASAIVDAQTAGAANDDDETHDDHERAHPDDVALLWRGFSGGLAADSKLPVRGAAWCPIDPDLFAVGNDAKQVHLGRSPGTGERVARVEHTFVEATGDYIRSVAFHATRPLRFVASDDLLVRIFDWQQRTQVAVARGHDHYVMRAVPHRTLPIFASASLDNTVRLWRLPVEGDAAEPRTTDDADNENAETRGWLSGCCRWWGPEVGEDADSVEHLATGLRHKNDVNYVEFDSGCDHQLYTASDDRTVVLWQFDETFARLSALRVIQQCGHNVWFVMPLPALPGARGPPLVLCGSEDHRIALVAPCEPPVVVRECRGAWRFWAAVTTPDASIAIVGHDAGFLGLRLPSSSSAGGFAPIQLPAPLA